MGHTVPPSPDDWLLDGKGTFYLIADRPIQGSFQRVHVDRTGRILVTPGTDRSGLAAVAGHGALDLASALPHLRIVTIAAGREENLDFMDQHPNVWFGYDTMPSNVESGFVQYDDFDAYAISRDFWRKVYWNHSHVMAEPAQLGTWPSPFFQQGTAALDYVAMNDARRVLDDIEHTAERTGENLPNVIAAEDLQKISFAHALRAEADGRGVDIPPTTLFLHTPFISVHNARTLPPEVIHWTFDRIAAFDSMGFQRQHFLNDFLLLAAVYGRHDVVSRVGDAAELRVTAAEIRRRLDRTPAPAQPLAHDLDEGILNLTIDEAEKALDTIDACSRKTTIGAAYVNPVGVSVEDLIERTDSVNVAGIARRIDEWVNGRIATGVVMRIEAAKNILGAMKGWHQADEQLCREGFDKEQVLLVKGDVTRGDAASVAYLLECLDEMIEIEGGETAPSAAPFVDLRAHVRATPLASEDEIKMHLKARSGLIAGERVAFFFHTGNYNEVVAVLAESDVSLALAFEGMGITALEATVFGAASGKGPPVVVYNEANGAGGLLRFGGVPISESHARPTRDMVPEYARGIRIAMLNAAHRQRQHAQTGFVMNPAKDLDELWKGINPDPFPTIADWQGMLTLAELTAVSPASWMLIQAQAASRAHAGMPPDTDWRHPHPALTDGALAGHLQDHQLLINSELLHPRHFAELDTSTPERRAVRLPEREFSLLS